MFIEVKKSDWQTKERNEYIVKKPTTATMSKVPAVLKYQTMGNSQAWAICWGSKQVSLPRIKKKYSNIVLNGLSKLNSFLARLEAVTFVPTAFSLTTFLQNCTFQLKWCIRQKAVHVNIQTGNIVLACSIVGSFVDAPTKIPRTWSVTKQVQL